MYTAKEVSTIAELMARLIAERKIGFQLDAFGNPEADYTKEAADVLVAAITDLASFPLNCVVENAMRDAQFELRAALFGGFKEWANADHLKSKAFAIINRAIYDAAFLDISDKLFTTKQIQAMLRLHPDYPSTRESDIRIGKLEREEMEDLARPKTGILSADEFNKSFKECA